MIRLKSERRYLGGGLSLCNCVNGYIIFVNILYHSLVTTKSRLDSVIDTCIYSRLSGARSLSGRIDGTPACQISSLCTKSRYGTFPI